MRLRLQRYSYRFAEHVLNSRLALKQEIEDVLLDPGIDIASLSRPHFNEVLQKAFVTRAWQNQPAVFNEAKDPTAKLDFLKERIGIEIQFGHSSFIGIDLLKFQVASYSGLDKIDVGVYIVTTHGFQKQMKNLSRNWEGSLAYEKVTRYLPHFKSAVQVPIWVLGIDV
jgi:hypothetical protein